MKKTTILICALLCLTLIMPVSLAAGDALFEAFMEKAEENAALREGHLTEPTAYAMLPDRLRAEWDRYRFVYTREENVETFTRDNAVLTDEEFERVVFSPLYPVLSRVSLMDDSSRADAVERFVNTFSADQGMYLVSLDGKPLAVMQGNLSSYGFSLTGIVQADIYDEITGRYAIPEFLFLGIGPSVDMITDDGTVLALISWDKPPVTSEIYLRAFELSDAQFRKDRENDVPMEDGGPLVYEYLFGSRRAELDASFADGPSRAAPVVFGAVAVGVVALALMAAQFRKKAKRA